MLFLIYACSNQLLLLISQHFTPKKTALQQGGLPNNLRKK